MSRIAASTSGAIAKPSCETKRAARIMRSGSSPKDSSGAMGVRSTPAVRSRMPSCRSTNSRLGRRTAIALTVKSRRARSPASVSPKVTSGLRESTSYDSDRYVVISRWWSPLRAPTVPKRIPTSHTWSAHPRTSSSMRSGRASVVRSRSWATPARPSMMSRTGPPTRASSCPASANRPVRGARASAMARRVAAGEVAAPERPDPGASAMGGA